jgi:hypothetical protein
MRKILAMVLAGVVLMGISGCGKTGEVGPMGPKGDTGATGPNGPGYASITINPDKDTLISTTTGNLGNQPTVSFGYASGAPYRALIHFDMAAAAASLPSDAVLVDAILTFTPNAGFAAGNFLSCHVYPLTKEWIESGATWTQATSTISWGTVGSDFVTTSSIGSFLVDPTTAASITCSFDVGFIQGWLKGQVDYGFVVKSDTESGVDSFLSVYSRDASSAAQRPSLRLIYGRTSAMGMSATSIRATYWGKKQGIQ